MTIKKIISCFLVILWLVVIFFLSNMDSSKSNQKSEGVINKVVETTLDKTNDLGITNKHPSQTTKNEFIIKLNTPFRKFMHAFVYLILAILVFNALYVSSFNKYKFYLTCFSFCFIYSLIDEYHQTFVIGRTGQFIDSIIDTFGSLIGIIICIFYLKKVKKFDA